MRVIPFGPSAVLVETAPDAVGQLWRALRDRPPAGVVDVVAGMTSVLLRYDGTAPSALAGLPDAAGLDPVEPRCRSVPVVYDGADLEAVAALTGMSREAVASLHAGGTYTVAMVGFSPGFAYLTGGDPRLAVPRLDSPRPAVPAGSVAVAAGLTAVYPRTTPGGWRLLGRTDAALFDPAAAEPSLLGPGDRVQFVPVAAVGPVPPWPEPALLAAGSQPALELLDAGGRLTVQDLGRPGWAHAGVPSAGAADRASAIQANALVGNPPGSPLLEVTLGWCRIRMTAPATLAVTGAPAALTVGGLPARARRALPLAAGSELLVGPAPAGVHTYLAIAGGLAVEPVLGSCCRDTLSGLGPRPLRPGDRLGAGPARSEPVGRPGPVAAAKPPTYPGPGGVVQVGAVPGPAAIGAPRLLDALAGGEWTVGAASDRTGARLEGPALPDPGPAAPTGMVPGAVQLPPGGQPVVLLRNHPATGGYPVIAVVDDPGVDLLSQCRPGVRVRFRFDSPTSAGVAGLP